MGATQKDNAIHFKDGETAFSAEEWVFLKDQINNIKEVTITEGEILQELKALFDK